MQIGDANRIAFKTGITTVADFRRKDLAAGGEGAPLTPAFHKLAFSSNEEDRAVLNIGGISNITCLPSDNNQPCFGFDTGPGNMLMDSWTDKHHNQPYDKNGEWAASVAPDSGLVNLLLNDPFIQQSPPKSTGREHYNLGWLDKQLEQFPGLDAPTIQASLCAFTVQSIRLAIEKFTPGIKSLIVCGGGVHNLHLMHSLDSALPGIQVSSSEEYGLHPDWIEATAFAWLAKQTLEGRPGNLPEVTGASSPLVLGAIYPA